MRAGPSRHDKDERARREGLSPAMRVAAVRP
jgi:hypothetical protein